MPAPLSILPLSRRVTLGQLLRATAAGGIFGVWADCGPAGRPPAVLRIQGITAVTLLLGRDLGALVERVAVVIARRRGRVTAVPASRLREMRWLELGTGSGPHLLAPLGQSRAERELVLRAARGLAAESSRIRYLG